MRTAQRASFWIGVGGISLLAPVLLNLAADRFGDKLPGLVTLNNYTTRRNG